MTASSILRIYLVACAAYLAGLFVLPDTAQLIFKALLLPLLMAAVWRSPTWPDKALLLGALFFSWVGDVVIGFQFILGLVAFLLAHLLYIALFHRAVTSRAKTKPYPWMAWALLGVYLIGFVIVLLPHLGALKIPVILYSLIIGAMLAMALRGRSHWPASAWVWIAGGALSFVLSDSLLAWNKFYAPLPLSALWIMSTYLFAQYAIVRGVLGIESSTNGPVLE
ncbi:MAG: lysoplasmalogenase [Saprospiraceae bacterium]|nr:lysoplasmalogenase [Saprospiraceae bacterium]